MHSALVKSMLIALLEGNFGRGGGYGYGWFASQEVVCVAMVLWGTLQTEVIRSSSESYADQ